MTVANGNNTVSRSEVPQFPLKVGDHQFTADLWLLKFADCQIVLGIDWLRELSPITFDFRALTLQFHHAGKMVILKGLLRVLHYGL